MRTHVLICLPRQPTLHLKWVHGENVLPLVKRAMRRGARVILVNDVEESP